MSLPDISFILRTGIADILVRIITGFLSIADRDVRDPSVITTC